MKELSENAKQRLDKYINEVKFSLKGCKSVDPDDIIADIYEHIDGELAEIDEPVCIDGIEAVLKKLGSPSQWVADEDISWWRTVVIRLQNGPEDWRLAYMSFAALVVSILFGGSMVTVALIPVSFILSRAALSNINNINDLGAQRWLIYPSLFIVYAFAGFWLLAWPFCALFFGLAPALLRADIHAIAITWNYEMPYWWVSLVLTCAGTSLWLLLVGVLYKAKPVIFEFCFSPFLNNIKNKWVNIYITITLLMTILFSVICVLMVRHEGWHDFVRIIGG